MGRMPAVFIGHGSPMNAIEENCFIEKWIELGRTLPKPKAILCISAHWFTKGTRVLTTEKPRMIYDMYGFPKELYEIKYPANGAPDLACKTVALIQKEVLEDSTWGYDHGTWSILCRMYPNADIPVFQLSVDANATAQEHYEIGKEIASLRDQGVMILGSGNVVHNLSLVNWEMSDQGEPWAYEFDDYISANILAHKPENVIHFETAGNCARKAFYTMDHFAPLLYVLGSAKEDSKITIFNQACTLGALSMTSYVFE